MHLRVALLTGHRQDRIAWQKLLQGEAKIEMMIKVGMASNSRFPM